MPRGRPRKNTTTKQETEQQQEQNYYQTFAKTMLSMVSQVPYLNPYLQNDLLKNINMNPHKFDRDKVEELLKNPKNNEQALRALSEYLENNIMHFKRLVFYYGCILTFDNYLEPTNADEEDMKTPGFKRSYKRAVNWIDNFNIKKTFTDVLRRIVAEEAIFYYVRESEAGITLQEMPSAWCKIVRKTDYGYQYSFNMLYFCQTGIDINDYAPEFKEYFVKYMDSAEYKNGIPFWKELDPLKAPVFKFDENRAGIVSPLAGLFVDSVEIATFKELLKTKTKLDVWKILINKIPLMNDGKTSTKNNFAIDATTAAQFNTLIQQAVPEGVKSITTPLEAEAIDFNQSENKNNIVGIGEDMFYSASGTSPILFGEKNATGIGIQSSIKTDEAFIRHVYFNFERFINAQLKQITGRYRFKIHLEGTIFDQEERFERALKAASVGAPKTYLAVAMGKTLDEFLNMLHLENTVDIVDKMIPLQSAHTQSGDVGRPEKSTGKLTPSGEQTRDNGSNLTK